MLYHQGMTLRESILDYLQVCGSASSRELSEVLGVNYLSVLREVKRLTGQGEISARNNCIYLAGKPSEHHRTHT